MPLNARPERRWCSTRCKDARRRDPWRQQLEAVSEPPDDHELDADLVPWLMAPEVNDPEPGLFGVPPAWFADARCLDHPEPDLWFPEGQGASSRAAQEVCDVCPVRDSCFAYAVACGFEVGVFGGVNMRQVKQRAA
jgi:WhiB family redox-sensing transcriptional regulator